MSEAMKNTTVAGQVTITSKRMWSATGVRSACISNDLYTRGDNEAYSKMLGFVDGHQPTTEAIYRVAKDIADHSREQTICNVMFILEREAVVTSFEIDGSDEI